MIRAPSNYRYKYAALAIDFDTPRQINVLNLGCSCRVDRVESSSAKTAPPTAALSGFCLSLMKVTPGAASRRKEVLFLEALEFELPHKLLVLGLSSTGGCTADAALSTPPAVLVGVKEGKNAANKSSGSFISSRPS